MPSLILDFRDTCLFSKRLYESENTYQKRNAVDKPNRSQMIIGAAM